MSSVKPESPTRYLNSRLGEVNEALKKAYISGKRIVVLVTKELDFVSELLARESVIPVKTEKWQVEKGTATSSGYNTVQIVDDKPDFIKADPAALKCVTPTVYLITNGNIPQASLINFARLFSPLASLQTSGNEALISNLRKSIIMIVSPVNPAAVKEESDAAGQKSVPGVCESLVECIEVPYLSESEFKGLLSDWLHRHEGMPVSTTPDGFSRIADESFLERMFQAMRALSPAQIESCLKRCSLEFGKVYHSDDDPTLQAVINSIRRVSQSVISRSSALSLKDTSNAAMPNGLPCIIDWLDRNKDRITRPAPYERYEMRPPKGILVCGIPGSGKSMLAKHIGAQLKLSLVRLDLGDALGRYVGESEKGFNTALEVAESLSPCVLWIDEMEKMFEGGHEVTRRLIGKFLTWMQEKTDRGVSCFVFATANDISKMPPEMFRTGRFDEKFYTFMPGADDCADIFGSIIASQTASYRRKSGKEALGLPLFNTDKVNGHCFLKLLNTKCLPSPITAAWKEAIPRDNKFFIGSDIEQLIASAKTLYCLRHKSEESRDAIFDSELFMSCLEEALESMKTYGETNLEQIAQAFSQIAKNNFAPCTTSVIMPVEGYDEAGYRNAVRKDRNTSVRLYSLKDEQAHLHSLRHEYDRQLYLVVSRILNLISYEIISRNDENSRR